MLLYISGSYPDNKEGIASGAKVLLDAMIDVVGTEQLLLLTTNTPIITNSIDTNAKCEYKLLSNWKVNKRNKEIIYNILDAYPITAIHMEYPGDLYGKTFLASFLPLIVCKYNKKKKKNITFNVRLHEFTRSRFLRKIAILPILRYADRIYVPALKDREIVTKYAKNKVLQTTIGTNIKVVSNELIQNDKVTISYFGSVYPGKGIEHMLSIWKQLKEKDEGDIFDFKIIGEIDTDKDNHFREYHEQVWKWIEEYGLKDCINVTGYISDEEVSEEIQHTQIATLFYEDGLTLRRGSFLAYLAHGIPIVTSEGDKEAHMLFDDHKGIVMAESDEDIINSIFRLSRINKEKREEIRNDNIELSKHFDWSLIAENFMRDYGIK